MSSPNLNNLIIVGCLLSYSGVIILGLDSSLTSEPAFRYICTVKAWVLMAGFTLSFGSMFSKTWRVHSIFTNVQLNKKERTKMTRNCFADLQKAGQKYINTTPFWSFRLTLDNSTFPRISQKFLQNFLSHKMLTCSAVQTSHWRD